MLRKELRIRKQRDFDRIFSEGKFFSEKWLALKIVDNKLGFSRFAFVVSNKVSKKAYKRNRIKRVLRESVKSSLGEIKQGFDFVFIVRSDVSSLKKKDVDKVVDMLLKKHGLMS